MTVSIAAETTGIWSSIERVRRVCVEDLARKDARLRRDEEHVVERRSSLMNWLRARRRSIFVLTQLDAQLGAIVPAPPAGLGGARPRWPRRVWVEGGHGRCGSPSPQRHRRTHVFIHGDWRIGSFAVKRDGTLGAIEAFGPGKPRSTATPHCAGRATRSRWASGLRRSTAMPRGVDLPRTPPRTAAASTSRSAIPSGG